MNSRFDLVVEEVNFLVDEAARLRETGPHFSIIHRWHEPGSRCLAGEEVAQVRFMSGGEGFPLKLGLGPLIMFDYLARNRWLPRNASCLAAEMNADPFCMSHGANAPGSRKQTRKFTHGSIKVFAQRIRDAMELAFRKAEVALDPHLVLMSEPGYRLMARADWLHLVDQRLVQADRSRDEDL